MKLLARVTVMPRKDILDPQGQAVGRALSGLGFADVGEVRVGKVIVLELGEQAAPLDAAARERLRARAAEMADRLLANPVVEDYTVEILET